MTGRSDHLLGCEVVATGALVAVTVRTGPLDPQLTPALLVAAPEQGAGFVLGHGYSSALPFCLNGQALGYPFGGVETQLQLRDGSAHAAPRLPLETRVGGVAAEPSLLSRLSDERSGRPGLLRLLQCVGMSSSDPSTDPSGYDRRIWLVVAGVACVLLVAGIAFLYLSTAGGSGSDMPGMDM